MQTPFTWRFHAGKEECLIHRGLSDNVGYKLASSSCLYLSVGLLFIKGKYSVSSGKKKKKPEADEQK